MKLSWYAYVYVPFTLVIGGHCGITEHIVGFMVFEVFEYHTYSSSNISTLLLSRRTHHHHITMSRPSTAEQERDRKRARLDWKENQALRRGRAFIESITPVPGDGVVEWFTEDPDLFYMPSVCLLSGSVKNIIISTDIHQFWKRCISSCTGRFRVCATGSPGVGKSTTMMYLIYLLLFEFEKRVVYVMRTTVGESGEREGFYYEWEIENGVVTTNVHPETLSVEDVIDERADNFKNTFFLCDPGATLDNCMPPYTFLANVIANASADDRHWGGGEFKKAREENYASGILLTFPLLTKKHIFLARTLMGDVDKQTLEKRHRNFGSIPRFLFASRSDQLEQQLQAQVVELANMSGDMAKRIMNNMAELNNYDSRAPKSSIMCVTSEAPEFLKSKASFVSDLVAEKAAKAHIRHLWNDISSEDNSTTRGLLFEAYVRSLLAGPEDQYSHREACGKASEFYRDYFDSNLGGCSEIRSSTDIVGDCRRAADGIIFYSFDEGEPLVDFIYKRGNIYYAIQVTIRPQHDCAFDKVATFLERLNLQANEELHLVYTVPNKVFKRFTTAPDEPLIPAEAEGVYIRHAEINPPQANL